MAKILDLSALTYYSNKIKKFISDNVNILNTKINNLSNEVNAEIGSINNKIQENTGAIGNNKKDIDILENKYEVLQDKLDNTTLECDGHPNGDTININNIEQYVFRDINAGDVIEIDNPTGSSDFLIECYEEVVGSGTEINHKVIDLNEANKDNLIYDERFIEVTSTGVKPRTDFILNYNSETVTLDNGDTYVVLTSDTIPADILNEIDRITSIGEE